MNRKLKGIELPNRVIEFWSLIDQRIHVSQLLHIQDHLIIFINSNSGSTTLNVARDKLLEI